MTAPGTAATKGAARLLIAGFAKFRIDFDTIKFEITFT